MSTDQATLFWKWDYSVLMQEKLKESQRDNDHILSRELGMVQGRSKQILVAMHRFFCGFGIIKNPRNV